MQIRIIEGERVEELESQAAGAVSYLGIEIVWGSLEAAMGGKAAALVRSRVTKRVLGRRHPPLWGRCGCPQGEPGSGENKQVRETPERVYVCVLGGGRRGWGTVPSLGP